MNEPKSLRTYIADAAQRGELVTIRREVSARFEAAVIINQLAPRPVLFERITGKVGRVAANVAASRAHFAHAVGLPEAQVLAALTAALEHPSQPEQISREDAPCQEQVQDAVDLDQIPILTHFRSDPGPYITSGVAIIHDPETGPNASFHRLLQLDKRRFAARLVEGRGTDAALKKLPPDVDLEIAICLGAPPHVLLAAAISPAPGVDEMAVANALAPTPLVRCQTKNLYVPAASEWVLEGRITHQLHREGPFVDLTETLDYVRQQPIIEIDCITHRRDPIYDALLPGGLEHKALMGVPREPTIFNAVNQVCICKDVYITPGGASWLHAVVQIEKRQPDDGVKAIHAVFKGHPSLKQVIIVDDDIDPRDPAAVEWAIATRFQADRNLVVIPDAGSSSLDPSAWHRPGQKAKGAKMGIDATIPWLRSDGTPRPPEEFADFRKVGYERVNLADYLE
jgi:2,5-furandicarboxylate decarboxylase 1